MLRALRQQHQSLVLKFGSAIDTFDSVDPTVGCDFVTL